VAKPKENRFEGFEDFKVVTPSASERNKSEQKERSKVSSQAKSKNPEFKKVTLYLTKDLHLKLRSATLTGEEDMSELVERVMEDYFKQLNS